MPYMRRREFITLRMKMRTNWTCSFPASSFHEDALPLVAVSGLMRCSEREGGIGHGECRNGGDDRSPRRAQHRSDRAVP